MVALLYDLIYMVPLGLMTTLLWAGNLGAPEQKWYSLAVFGLVLAICTSLKHWKNRLKYLAPGVVFMVSVGIVLIQKPEEKAAFLQQNQWVLWVALLTVACFFLGRFMAQYPLFRRVMALGLTADLIVSLFQNSLPRRETVIPEFLIVILCIAEEIQLYWKKSGYTDRRGHLVSIAPFLVLLAVSTAIFPTPDTPFQWTLAVKIWQKAVDSIQLTSRFFHFGDEDYNIVIGFSDSGTFWGNLKKKDKTVMELAAGAQAGDTIYLAGKVMDDFDGRGWHSTYTRDGRDRMMDTLESLCAVTALEPDYLRNYLWRMDMTITFRDFNTKYIFLPEKALLGTGYLNDMPFTTAGADVLADEQLGYGDSYTVTYFRLNRDHSTVQEFLRQPYDPDPELWEKIRMQYRLTGKRKQGENYGTDYEEYLAYRERIRQYYLPDTVISGQAEKTMAELMEGAETPYDKLTRLEKYLESFPYSDDPGALPAGVDSPAEFLDYFLYDLKEGYCSHYATAFVLLARSQGIPARYVQGYYVTRSGGGMTQVSSSMAHSWPEAYLDGIGWIRFEPTPGHRQRVSWAFQVKKTSEGPETEFREEDHEEQVPILEEEEPVEEGKTVRVEVVLIPLGLGLLFLIAFLAADRLMTRRWFRKLGDAERFRVFYGRNLRILEILGWKPLEGETLEEFGSRVARELTEGSEAQEQSEEMPQGEETGVLVQRFLEDYELVIYGGLKPDARICRRMEEANEVLLKFLKIRKGRWFFWYHFQITRKAT